METVYSDLVQQMFTFSYLADITEATYYTDFNQKNVEKEVGKGIYNTLKAVKQTDHGKAVLGDWALLNDPWVIRGEQSQGGWLAKNTTALFLSDNDKNSDPIRLAIAVAGTNFISKYDWFTEDAEVDRQCYWDIDALGFNPKMVPLGQGANVKDTPVIAYGTQTALSNTLYDHNGRKETLMDYLKNLMLNPQFWVKKTEIEIYVTGHSLGGAIAPAVAQALNEFQSLWFPTSPVNGVEVKLKSVTAVPFAGPTVGNASFVDHVAKTKTGIDSYYNTMDVVPHAWAMNDMIGLQNIFSFLFSKDEIDNHSAIVNQTIGWARSKSQAAIGNGFPYARWDNGKGYPFTENTFTPTTNIDWPAKMHEMANKPVVQAFLVSLLADIKTLEDCITICDSKNPLKINNCLKYFIMYMGMLGLQHVREYPNIIINDTKFLDVFMTDLGMGSATNLDEWLNHIENDFSKLISGPAVLRKLLNDVATYTKNHPKEALVEA